MVETRILLTLIWCVTVHRLVTSLLAVCSCFVKFSLCRTCVSENLCLLATVGNLIVTSGVPRHRFSAVGLALGGRSMAGLFLIGRKFLLCIRMGVLGRVRTAVAGALATAGCLGRLVERGVVMVVCVLVGVILVGGVVLTCVVVVGTELVGLALVGIGLCMTPLLTKRTLYLAPLDLC